MARIYRLVRALGPHGAMGESGKILACLLKFSGERQIDSSAYQLAAGKTA